MIGSLLARHATKSVLTTAAKTAMRGTLDATKRAVPHFIAHKVASTIAVAAKKRKRVDIDVKHSQEPQLKKAFLAVVSLFQLEVNIGRTNGGTCQLSWSGYITSRYSELFINIKDVD